MTIHKRTTILPCSKVLRHIQTELDSKLNRTAYRKMQKHLKNCPNCMCYLDSLKKVVYLYRYYSDIRPDTTSHKKFWTTIKWKMQLQ